MKMIRTTLLSLGLIGAIGIGSALAGGNDLALTFLNPSDLATLPGTSVDPAADWLYVYDATANTTGNIVKVRPGSGLIGSAFDGTVGATTPSTGAFTTLSTTGTVTFDDGSGASPSVVFQDGTDQTATFSKVDTSFLGLTTLADGGQNILVGNLKVGNGVPSNTLNGEDAYIEGGFEVDGPALFNGNVVATGDVQGDGNDQLWGWLQNQITSTTTTLTSGDCGSTIVNDSADVMTLPEASTVIGCRFTFITNNASNFDINPNDASDTITLLTNAAGDAVRNATVGNFLCLQAVDATNWSQCGIVGTWTDIN